MLTETQSSGASTNNNSSNDINQGNTINISNLKIWQQNVNKSQACQHDLISSGRLAKEGVDMIAIQEPAINSFGGTVTARDWTVIYPVTHGSDPSKTRSLILIRSNIVTDCWSQVEIDTGDVTAVLMKGSWGTIAIFNAYIDCTHERTIEVLAKATKSYEGECRGMPSERVHTLWLGDFNCHHPHWDSPTDTRLFTPEALARAEKLISAVASAGLDLALPPQRLTHRHSVTKKWTRLDQVFLSDHSLDALISCDVLQSTPGICTDHLPIITNLDMAVPQKPEKEIENFRNVDWEEFRKELKTQLRRLGAPAPIENQDNLNSECDKLTRALKETIRAQVPTSVISPKSKRWWTKELSNLRKKANKLGRKASKYRWDPGNPVHAEHEEAKKLYAKEIESSKRTHWRDWLERAEEPDIWTAHRYVSAAAADGSGTRIPTLKTQKDGQVSIATTNEEKGKMLAKTFFPTEKANASDDYNEEDATPVCALDRLEKTQISRHLSMLKPYKAPGPDGIPNIVLTKSADLILDRLYFIYDAMIQHKLYYAPWKKFTTVVLRKPGKPKYNVPKAYRPIALINTQVKVLTAILAEQLMYYAERHSLLPENHFGGRKCRNATDAVHLLVNKIKNAWRKGKVVSVLFLDIEGAFPNADNVQLIRNLTKRKIPQDLVAFVANMLKDRSTELRFDGYTSTEIILNNGIGQGDPLSMALYQFYNADLLDIPQGKEESAIAYVDDAILVAEGADFHQAHERISNMMEKEDGALRWAEKHNSRFEFSKLALIDFAHHCRKVERPTLKLPGAVIKPAESTKYLGVILDQHLLWREQLAYVVGKGSKWASQIRRVARPSWGLTPRAASRLYIGVALPRILYGLDIWCNTPKAAKEGKKPPQPIAYRKLASVQREGALAITGGYRTSPLDALDAHAALLPMHLRIRKVMYRMAVRMASLPSSHPLHKQLRAASRRKIRRHRAPMHSVAENLGIDPDVVETIPVAKVNPVHRGNLPFEISIAQSKDQSKREDNHAKEEIKVYTDGSIHNSQVGAAAVLFRKGKRGRTMRFHLGAAEDHTIYEAEMVGLLMGLQLIKTEKRNKTSCAMGADNQAAILALQSELTKPGQHIAAKVVSEANRLKKHKKGGNFSLKIRWTAGHCGIRGNTIADREAKQAAEGLSTAGKDLPKYIRKTMKRSLSALKQDHSKKANEAWKKEWNESERFARFKAPDIISPASKKFLKLISDHRIPKKTSSLIFQLRVGHAPLNNYLHRFKKVDSARCPACGEERETTEHFILRCPKYAHERWALLRHIKDNVPKIEQVLSDPKVIIPLTNYIDATERFKIQT